MAFTKNPEQRKRAGASLGFDGPYSGGRHLFMVKGGLKVRIPNLHRGDISKNLVAEILRQAEIPQETWESI